MNNVRLLGLDKCIIMTKFYVALLIIATFFSNNVFSAGKTFDALPKLKVIRSTEDRTHKIVDIEGYECPVEKLKDINHITFAAKKKAGEPKLKYCVFLKAPEDKNNDRCKTEVQPIFLPLYDQKTVNCGSSDTHQMYFFGFARCGIKQDIKEFRRREIRNNPANFKGGITPIEFYQVCYDIANNQAIWTKNRIKTPIVFDKLEINNEEFDKMEISVDSFLLEGTPFESTKQIYELESQKTESEGQPKMQPEALVSAEHFAYNIWKKTTTHIINTSHLWTELAILMLTINIGLKKAQMRLYSSNESSFPRLELYTRVTPDDTSNTAEKGKSLEDQLQPNIWVKFVHDERNKRGLLIYIHNTPNNPPAKKKCNESVECDFQRWIDDGELKDTLTANMVRYAYCCPATSEEVEKIFFIKIRIKNILDVDNLIIRGLKRKVTTTFNQKMYGMLTIDESSKISGESSKFAPLAESDEGMEEK